MSHKLATARQLKRQAIMIQTEAQEVYQQFEALMSKAETLNKRAQKLERESWDESGDIQVEVPTNLRSMIAQILGREPSLEELVTYRNMVKKAALEKAEGVTS